MAPSARQAVTAGAVLADTYEVTRLLGEGGMGAVWEARHLRLERKKVAIKVLHGFVAGDGEAVSRFQREANIASRLGHPNIIQVHDFNTLPGGAPYLVLEYLDGESLNERLRRGPLPLPEALAMARQIGSALQAAHNEGIVHRDLKPHNVFLCPSEAHGYATEQVKVLDFGISKIQGSETVKTQTNAILGTPQYMSPEQAKGAHRDIDHRTDVFALGAIVYEMLSGRAAFLGESIPEVMFKVVYEEPPPLPALAPGLPANVIAAVTRALLKDREQRCPSASAFVEELTGDPLNTLRGGPATANVHSPKLSASLAAAAASKNQSASAQGLRAASPEAFAATMATGDGRQPADAFGATMASAGPGAPVSPLAATAAQAPVGPGAHASFAPGQPYGGSLTAPPLAAHALGVADTTPVVERPRHVPRARGLRFLAAGSALLVAMGVTFALVRSMRDGDATAGTTGTSRPARAATTDEPAAREPAADPGQPSEVAAAGAGTAEPAQGAQAGQAGTAAGSDGEPADAQGSGAAAAAAGTQGTSGETTAAGPQRDTGGGEKPNGRDPDDRPGKGGDDVPAALKQGLNELEALLRKDPKEVISRAKRLLGKYPESDHVAAVLTRAYCLASQGNEYLSDANGMLSRIESRGLRRSVRSFCKKKGLTLGD